MSDGMWSRARPDQPFFSTRDHESGAVPVGTPREAPMQDRFDTHNLKPPIPKDQGEKHTQWWSIDIPGIDVDTLRRAPPPSSPAKPGLGMA
ncbi:MAG: hypothetical protein M4579_003120 [Chaenotheca gracillima]|nr:MAG: hypothetical protein M4579_003120 [Chaenotheca gracillima]